MTQWLKDAAERGIHYVDTVRDRPVFPRQAALDALQQFEENFPEAQTSSEEILHLLDELGSPATVATTGGRYFGFVQGALLPAAMATSWLMTAWDQNAALGVMSPIAAKLEEIAEKWLLDEIGRAHV